MSCGFWNVNNWNLNIHSDNYIIRKSCLDKCDLDIIGVAETHFKHGQNLDLNGYLWFGNNRKHLHVRARAGSGGVGVLVKESLCNDFNISIVDSAKEGILWVNFEPTATSGARFYVCVCYLPPEGSTRNVNVHDFYDTLLSDIYTIPGSNMFYICGDFNSRCANNDDFIRGIDKIQDRNVVDFCSNAFGDIFCDFLINANLCILNGRNFKQNDFTYVSPRGLSVVDYCLVPYESLNRFAEFTVTRASVC